METRPGVPQNGGNGLVFDRPGKKETLIDDLKETFDNLQVYKMMLNPAKCVFGVLGGKLLGFLVSERGIEANPEKIKAITSLAKPACINDVQHLAGCIAALSQFISRLGEKAISLYQMMKKTNHFVWSDAADQAFEALKKQLAESPVPTAPIDIDPLLLYVVANSRGVSMAIMVEKKESGKEYPVQWPVYYISEVLIESKQRCPNWQKLVYGMFMASLPSRWRLPTRSTRRLSAARGNDIVLKMTTQQARDLTAAISDLFGRRGCRLSRTRLRVRADRGVHLHLWLRRERSSCAVAVDAEAAAPSHTPTTPPPSRRIGVRRRPGALVVPLESPPSSSCSSRVAAALALAGGAYNGVAPGTHLRGGSSSRTRAAGDLLFAGDAAGQPALGSSAGLCCGFEIQVTRELLDLFISSSRSPLSTRFDQVEASLRGHMHALGI
ncbi:hypothetical protein TRIUR3_33527 [Triticum urartu]|uniref:Uncharacterized protein n=1 Tax=Triticum urartu TaxID=4572 RepID=M8AIK6_TRIUA|nr:hypothetical protein TRIUR3_33527 [Triticum urartu]